MKNYHKKLFASVSFLILFALNQSTAKVIEVGHLTNKDEGLGLSDIDKPKFEISRDIRCIFQDMKGNMWFGTDGEGVVKYDGKNHKKYNKKNGLVGDYVRAIIQDKSGNLWFSTDEGISMFDGIVFVDFTKKAEPKYKRSGCSFKDHAGNLWFGTTGGVYKYDGKTFKYMALEPEKNEKEKHPDPYSVYSIHEDRAGIMWFGTEYRGVCKFDGKTFEYFRDKDLDRGPVRSIYADSKGNLWFGNSGEGLFVFDGKTIKNLSSERGLRNTSPVKNYKTIPGTLASVMSISEDKSGKIWVGTFDTGIWQFDGNNLINIKNPEAMLNNSIRSIYRDRQGNLWFGTIGGGISKFNGRDYLVLNKPDMC